MIHFKPTEFSESLDYADTDMLTALDNTRTFCRFPIFPSPTPGALARFDLGAIESRHYALDRKSDAIDFFCDCGPFEAWSKIVQAGYFKRVGVYFDTFFKHRKWVMFHGDLKPSKLLWLRYEGKYTYSTNPIFYHKLFKLFFLCRENIVC